jgi:site-specific DNA-methyltransferase (adenine-specific)
MTKSETFNIDCLEYLRGCKDNQFSLACIDPPYSSTCLGVEGNTWKGKYGRFGGLFTKYHNDLSVKNNVNHASGGKLFGKYSGESDARNWDSDPPSEEFWEQIFRVCKYHVVWGGNYFPLPPSRNFIIWKKPISENFSMAMVEYAWTDIPGNAKIVTYSPQDKFRFHPCLPEGELVFINNDWKPIEDVQAGDISQYGKVNFVSSHWAENIVTIQLESGLSVQATSNHPFLVLESENTVVWKEAGIITDQDCVLTNVEVCKQWLEKANRILPRKDTLEHGMETDNSLNMMLSGKVTLEKYLKVCKSILKMETKQIIELKTSLLLAPLNTNGRTQVADVPMTVDGENNALIAEGGSMTQMITDVKDDDSFTLPCIKSVPCNKFSNIVRLVSHRVESVCINQRRTKVYNLSICGVPAFDTLIGVSHNTQKPIALYSKIYEWYGDYCKGGVLDTFLGSGSNRIAAYDAGYDFVGIELNKVYFEKEKKRFSDHIAEGDMFSSSGLNIVESEEGLF